LIIASIKSISDAARARVRIGDREPLLRYEMRMLAMTELGHQDPLPSARKHLLNP
jgi:hypothetical protein